MIYSDILETAEVFGALDDIAGQRLQSRFALRLRKLKRELEDLASDGNAVITQLRNQFAAKNDADEPIMRKGEIVICDEEGLHAALQDLYNQPAEIERIKVDLMNGLRLSGATWSSALLIPGDEAREPKATVSIKNRLLYPPGQTTLGKALTDLTRRRMDKEAGLYLRPLLVEVNAQMRKLNNAHFELLSAYVQRDPEGQRTVKDNRFQFETDTLREQYQEKFNELLNEEFLVTPLAFDKLAGFSFDQDLLGETWLAPFILDE